MNYNQLKKEIEQIKQESNNLEQRRIEMNKAFKNLFKGGKSYE